MFQCDYWSFDGAEIFFGCYRQLESGGNFPTPFIPPHTVHNVGVMSPDMSPRLQALHPIMHEMIVAKAPKHLAWEEFSMTAAIALAVVNGAKSIQIFGADWKASAPDWDGYDGSVRFRDADRFYRERVRFDVVKHWAKCCGVEVKRMIPELSTVSNA